MHFVSWPFVAFYLIVFSGYWLLRHQRHRLLWLLVASCVFYMSWKVPDVSTVAHQPSAVSSEGGRRAPWLILLILFSASVDYIAALAMERTASAVWRRRLLILSVVTNLGLLAYFKYTNFLLGTIDSASGYLGFDLQRPFLTIALPLGISFYTFETISYVVDVYRGKTKALRNLLDYALYIMFFPHLLAGPIVRPADFLPQLHRPKKWSWARLYLGARLFLLGMFKKAVLADYLAGVVDPTFQNPGQFHSASLWLAVLAYAMQVYGDFSGYSDMAIGIAHTFGYKLPANFNMPYFAANIAEFWKRWHISLSRWLRDYLFISMGGSRGGEWATYRNLIVTMFLGGLWHGANWPSVLWGLYHGLLLAGHRALSGQRWLAAPWFQPLRIPLTFLSCCLGLAIFRSQSIGDIGVVLSRLVVPTAGQMLETSQILIGVTGILAVFIGHALGTWGRLPTWERRVPEPVMGAVWATLLLIALMLLPDTSKAFIYFNF
jgi:alginate O-acetyltransferase complex protein AlgI